MASLGLVSPGAAADGVTPRFFLKKTYDLFYSSPSISSAVHPIFPSKNCKLTIFFFAHHCHLLGFHSGVTPRRVSTGPYLPVRSRLSTVLWKFSHKVFFSFGCHLLEGVTRGGPPLPPPLPLVTPLVFEAKNLVKKLVGMLKIFLPEDC